MTDYRCEWVKKIWLFSYLLWLKQNVYVIFLFYEFRFGWRAAHHTLIHHIRVIKPVRKQNNNSGAAIPVQTHTHTSCHWYAHAHVATPLHCQEGVSMYVCAIRDITSHQQPFSNPHHNTIWIRAQVQFGYLRFSEQKLLYAVWLRIE